MSSSTSSSPTPGRPTVPLAQAAKILGKDWRTVKKLVEARELEGGSTLVAKRRTYYVYADQLAPHHTAQHAHRSRDVADEVAELQRELKSSRAAEATAREAAARAEAAAASAQEANRLLQANQAILLSAVKDFHSASDDTAGLIDDYRALIDRHWSVSERYRSSASNFARAADTFQSIIGGLLTPDDASALTPRESASD